MNPSLGEAVLRTKLDTTGLRTGFAQGRTEAQRALDQIDSRIQATGARLNSIGTRFSVGITAPLLAAGAASLKLASDAEEIGSKFEAVFRDNTRDAEAFAQALGRNVGRAQNDLKNYLATLQDTFVPLGFARDRAAELSKELTTLAIDVASFNNKADGEVLRDFQSALVGNTETVRKYGIVITAANTEQKALELGLARTKNELTEQDKVYARYIQILEGSTDAQGDAIRTAGSAANSYKAFRAAISDTSAELGQKFLPAATRTLQSATELIRGFSELDERTQDLIIRGALLAGALGPIAIGLGRVVTAVGQLRTAMVALRAAALPLLGPAGLIVGGTALLVGLGTAFVTTGGRARTATEALEETKNAVGKAGDKDTLADNIVRFSDYLDGDGKSFLQNYAQEIRNAKGDLDDLKAAASATLAEVQTAALLQQKAIVEAQMRALSTAQTSAQDPAAILSESQDRLTRQFGYSLGTPVSLELREVNGQLRIVPDATLQRALVSPAVNPSVSADLAIEIARLNGLLDSNTGTRRSDLQRDLDSINEQLRAMSNFGTPFDISPPSGGSGGARTPATSRTRRTIEDVFNDVAEEGVRALRIALLEGNSPQALAQAARSRVTALEGARAEAISLKANEAQLRNLQTRLDTARRDLALLERQIANPATSLGMLRLTSPEGIAGSDYRLEPRLNFIPAPRPTVNIRTRPRTDPAALGQDWREAERAGSGAFFNLSRLTPREEALRRAAQEAYDKATTGWRQLEQQLVRNQAELSRQAIRASRAAVVAERQSVAGSDAKFERAAQEAEDRLRASIVEYGERTAARFRLQSAQGVAGSDAKFASLADQISDDVLGHWQLVSARIRMVSRQGIAGSDAKFAAAEAQMREAILEGIRESAAQTTTRNRFTSSSGVLASDFKFGARTREGAVDQDFLQKTKLEADNAKRVADEQLKAAEQFKLTVVSAAGQAGNVLVGAISGRLSAGGALAGLGGAVGGIVGMANPLAGAIVTTASSLVGGLFDAILRNPREEEERRRATIASQSRSVPSIQVNINQNATFNYQGNPADARADLAMMRQADLLAGRLIDALVPRLERLEQRVGVAGA